MIGFSGSQEGMSERQIEVVNGLLEVSGISKAGHGDCIGSDADFHVLSREHGLYMVGYPPLNYKKRAFCKFDFEHRPNEYLVRNKNIVNDSDCMIFTPKEMEEQLRSGTWSTYRYAKKKQKDYILVFPDGSMEQKKGGGGL